MNDLPYAAIQCRLYLQAVLPALGELVRLVPEAHEIVARVEGQVRMSRWRGPWVALGIERGRIRQLSDAEVQHPLDVVFLTDGQVNRLFGGKGWALPVITAGFGRWRILQPFRRLAALLKEHLQAPDREESDPARWRVHARLLLSVVLRAVREIGEHDSKARMILSQTPEGQVEFRIGDWSSRPWIRWRKNPRLIETGEEPSSVPPDVIITFRDERTVAAAMQPGFDTAAAMGRGDIVVRGLLPLAEGLGLVMERVSSYLEAP